MEGWQEQAASALLAFDLPALVEDSLVLLADRGPSLVQLRFPFQQVVIAGTTWQHDAHVFTTVQGRPIDPTNLTRTFTTIVRKAGLRRIRFHGLRHSTATLLLEQGVELVVIKELLGHAHIGVTATVYAHVRLRLQRDAIDSLGHALDHP